MSQRDLQESLHSIASQCAVSLAKHNAKVILAESCTAGLVAATLARIPGISSNLCGSFVTYRESLKVQALGVSEETLARHSAESEQTTLEMLTGALANCKEATIGLAITGHLGPGAREPIDGVIYIASGTASGKKCQRAQLLQEDRVLRQMEAASIALEQLNSVLTH